MSPVAEHPRSGDSCCRPEIWNLPFIRVMGAVKGKGARMASKPDSVQEARAPVDGHSSGPAVTNRIKLPTRTSGLKKPWRRRREVPIWHCSGWGLPCEACCQPSGGLLPHLFTVTPQAGLSVFCGAFPRVAPAGRYPAPFLHGVRTFLAHPAMHATIQPSARV